MTIGCFEKNIVYPGNDMNGKKEHENYALGQGMRDNPEDCQHLCQQTEGCVAFTFKTKGRESGGCWLKYSKSEGIQLSPKKGAISGNKYCKGKFFGSLEKFHARD